MLVLAKSIKGTEFLYIPSSAHRVSERSGKRIMNELNRLQWNLKGNEVWHIHEIDSYDNAYYFAQNQSFTIYKGIIKERRSEWL